jgi:hypothetical protein
MGWEAGVVISAALVLLFLPVIVLAYLLARLPVNRLVKPEHPVLRRVPAVVLVLVAGKLLFSFA